MGLVFLENLVKLICSYLSCQLFSANKYISGVGTESRATNRTDKCSITDYTMTKTFKIKMKLGCLGHKSPVLHCELHCSICSEHTTCALCTENTSRPHNTTACYERQYFNHTTKFSALIEAMA